MNKVQPVHLLASKMTQTGMGFMCLFLGVLILNLTQLVQEYLTRAKGHRGPHGPVVVSLRAPFTAVCASYIARVLDESTSLAGLAGLAGLGYTAKSFLATRVTCAIEGKKQP